MIACRTCEILKGSTHENLCGGAQAFDRKAIAYYMPSLEEVAERRLSLWAKEGHVEALRQCKDLAFDVATIVLISDMPVRAPLPAPVFSLHLSGISCILKATPPPLRDKL